MESGLTRRGDYAVRAVLELARHHGRGRRKAREVSTVTDVPPRYLPQILGSLVQRGFLLATAGPEGGYELARPPDEITLLEVVEAIEGPFRAEVCVLRGGPCDWDRVCPVHVPWTAAERAFRKQLASWNFEELAAADAAIEGGQYPTPADAHSGSRLRSGIRNPLEPGRSQHA
ncbi:MAG: Rrf2 family transcriptional regulator [Dehalococcoidia bacterium]